MIKVFLDWNAQKHLESVVSTGKPGSYSVRQASEAMRWRDDNGEDGEWESDLWHEKSRGGHDVVLEIHLGAIEVVSFFPLITYHFSYHFTASSKPTLNNEPLILSLQWWICRLLISSYHSWCASYVCSMWSRKTWEKCQKWLKNWWKWSETTCTTTIFTRRTRLFMQEESPIWWRSIIISRCLISLISLISWSLTARHLPRQSESRTRHYFRRFLCGILTSRHVYGLSMMLLIRYDKLIRNTFV